MSATHVRTQIRSAVTAALATATGLPVYASRPDAVELSTLPALLVWTDAESAQPQATGFPRTMKRTLLLRVLAVAKATSDLDDAIDEICRQVEIALSMPCAALSGIAQRITLEQTQIRLAIEGSTPTGQAAMTFEVLYMAAENSPDKPH